MQVDSNTNDNNDVHCQKIIPNFALDPKTICDHILKSSKVAIKIAWFIHAHCSEKSSSTELMGTK
jgi:hypothetical protein